MCLYIYINDFRTEIGSHLLYIATFPGCQYSKERQAGCHCICFTDEDTDSQAILSMAVQDWTPGFLVSGSSSQPEAGTLCSAFQGSGCSVDSCTPQVGTMGPWWGRVLRYMILEQTPGSRWPTWICAGAMQVMFCSFLLLFGGCGSFPLYTYF
jgi:hypothetical protein